MKRFYYLFAVLLAVVLYAVTAYALTAEEMLLLKRGGISDEKILEIQRKEGSAPTPKINPFDWDEDGKKDIIAGSDSGRVYVYLNTGTNLEPIFNKPIEISGAEIMRFSDPYIVDWNNDGRKDLLIGARSGEVSVFINKGTNQQPIFGGELILNNGSLDVGYSSSPTMADWNGDGKKDLVVGNQSGDVFAFLNIGENYDPAFSLEGIATGIKVHRYATPFALDWNNDGKFDVVCGSENGKTYIFINEGDSKNPKFSNAQILQVNNKEFKLPSPTSVIAVDWNDDGKTDLLVSNKEFKEKDPGGRDNIIPPSIYLLLNTGTKEKPEFKELKEIKGKFRDDTVL
jgi:hypothetical protein